MKFYLIFFLCACAACQTRPENQDWLRQMENGKWIDLSYDFSAETIYWPNNPVGFRLDTQFNGTTAGGYYYSSNAFFSPEHGGTHLDAPVHFAKDKWAVDQIPPGQLMGAATVIDITQNAAGNADYLIGIEDVQAWENIHGAVPDNTILLFRTGWGRFYPDKEKYMGTAEKGDSAVTKLHFPGIDPALANWLIKNRNLKAIGIDTPSIDYGQSKDFKTHRILYAANIPGFENLAQLDLLPATGSYIIALPMKIRNGTGAPLRIIARVD